MRVSATTDEHILNAAKTGASMRTRRSRKGAEYESAGLKQLSFRTKSTEHLRKVAIAQVQKTITSRLVSEHSSLKSTAGLMEVAGAPARSLLRGNPKAVAATLELTRRFQRELTARLEEFKRRVMPSTTLELNINPGLGLLGPPYDLAWTLPLSSANRQAGTFDTQALGSMSAASGIGLDLFSPVRAAVSFRPVVSFKYHWTNLPYQGPAATRGGLGMLVYRNKEAQPFHDRRVTLWSDWRDWTSPEPFIGDGAGHFAQQFSPSDLLLQFEAGDSFRVWLWSWSIVYSQQTSGIASLATGLINSRVDFVLVNAGPPLPPVR